MSVVSHVAVYNVRSHEHFSVDISPGVTVITGANGSGKTTLLESIYIALQGSSFKGSDGDILSHEKPWWRIELGLDGDTRTITFDPEKQTKRKQFIVQDKTMYRLSPKHKYPVVLFDPDDLRLLHGSPSRRRDYIDRFISQLNPLYQSTLRRYERALKQRNNLLKRPDVTRDQLFAWDIAISDYGSYLIEQRIAFIEKINSRIADDYNTIAASHDTISIHYSHTLIGDGKQKLLNELHANYERDRITGSTSVGPHRHDVIFKYNDSLAISVASRGEVRTIILALKFLEVAIIEQLTGNKPIILLDDVFSELDIDRQHALSNTINSHQIIITSTHVVSSDTNFLLITL